MNTNAIRLAQRGSFVRARGTFLYMLRGWYLYDNGASYHPRTGRYMAYQHGVRLGAHDEGTLVRMIYRREADSRG